MIALRCRQLAITIVFAALMGGGLVLFFFNQKPLEVSATKPRAFGAPLAELSDPSNRVPDDDRIIKLETFALSVPSADDPADREDETTEPLLFRDPVTLEPLDEAKLDALGIPRTWRDIGIAGRTRPQLRLIFRKNPELSSVEVGNEVRLWDARTGAEIKEAATSVTAHPDLIEFDIGVGIWHDTPVTVGLSRFPRIFSGSPEWPYRLFQIHALPDMPNGREIENLFDVRIPRLAVHEAPWSNYTMETRMARIAASAVELKPVGVRNNVLGWVERTETLKNLTPRDLLDRHAQAHRRVVISVDPDTDTLNFSYPEPWPEQFRNWWNGWAPDWLHVGGFH